MATIAILGATGRVGHAAAKAFAAAGWQVRGISRSASADTLGAGIEPITADAFDEAAVTKACQGADIVMHALNPAYDRWADSVMPLARNALAAARATGATIMIPGNVYVYGTRVGPDTDEMTSTADPDIEKGRLRVEMEEMFARAAQDSGQRTIIIRAGDFFGGTQTGSWLDLMILKDVRKGKFVWPGPWDCMHAFAYMPDLAQTFVAVADRRDTLDPFTRLHFGGHTLTGEQMHAAAQRATGRTLKRGGVPWPVIRAIGLFNPMMRAVAEMSYLWRVPHSLDNGRLTALIGEEPHTPIEEALRRSIADLDLDAVA